MCWWQIVSYTCNAFGLYLINDGYINEGFVLTASSYNMLLQINLRLTLSVLEKLENDEWTKMEQVSSQSSCSHHLEYW